MTQTGFTQLGKRLSAQEKREYARRIELSVLCINLSGRSFRMPAFERTAAMVAALSPLAELILVDLDAPHSRNDLLLEEFPWMRIIIPTARMGLAAAVALGVREALGQRIFILDTASAIAFFDIPKALQAFREDRRLFAIGPAIVAGEETECPVRLEGRLVEGRLRIDERIPLEAGPSLALRRFCGLYDREKVLFLGAPPDVLPPDWAALEWFVAAWSRGWRTMVDPAHCLYIPGEWQVSMLPGAGFLERVRFVRQEIGFLRRHCPGRDQVRARRHSIFFKAWANIFRLDFTLLFAGLTHNRFRRHARNTLCSLQEVLLMAAASLDPRTEQGQHGADEPAGLGQAAGLRGMLEEGSADKEPGVQEGAGE